MYAQLLFNTLVSGMLLALVAVGFNLIFNTTKVFHLAHGAVYVVGSYALMQALEIMGHNSLVLWMAAFAASLGIVIAVSWLIEWLVYQPLARKKSGQAITLISSIGVYLFLVNLVAMGYGNETKFLAPELGKSFTLGKVIIVPVQMVQLTTASLLIGLLLAVSKSRWYLQVRAMISEETVASVLGVNTKAIRLWAMAVGGGLAGIASILHLYDTGIDPQSGMSITLSAAVAVIIGGKGSIKGSLAASLLIATLQTGTEWFISAQWKEGMTFLLLIAVILWRTEGIISFKMRVEQT